MYCEMGHRLAAEKIVDNVGPEKKWRHERALDSKGGANANANAEANAETKDDGEGDYASSVIILYF